ncbi:MAG: beta-lactamase family protein [Clostridia bacterium]|nr:beta-lactamase family protein [Clostridia bacterium]
MPPGRRGAPTDRSARTRADLAQGGGTARRPASADRPDARARAGAGPAGPPWAEALSAHVEAERRRRHIPGLALAATQDGRESFAQGFGLRDREAGLPVTPDTVFGVGSIAKAFTCVAILQLAERGKLALLDPVARYLPEFRTADPDWTKRMTIHHFMTHTSGLPPLPAVDRLAAPGVAGDPKAASEGAATAPPIATPEELLAFIASEGVEPLGEPGRYFSYSNAAYALLGLVVARVADLPYEDYVFLRILRPLGMERTTFSPEAASGWEDVAVPYAGTRAEKGRAERSSARAQPVAARAFRPAPALSAAGFLLSTARDLLRFADIFRTGGVGRAEVGRRLGRAPAGAGRRILTGESVRRMTHPHAALAPGLAYGYGLTVHRGYHGLTLVGYADGHAVGPSGQAAAFEVAPEIGVAAVELANLPHPSPGFAAHAVVNGALGLPLDARRLAFPEATCPAERLSDYAGRFAAADGVVVRVDATRAGLRFEVEGERLRARPVAPDAFAVRRGEEEVYARFLRDEAGRIFALHWGFRIVPRAPAPPRAPRPAAKARPSSRPQG